MMQTVPDSRHRRSSAATCVLAAGVAAAALSVATSTQADPAAPAASKESADGWPRGPRGVLIRPDVEAFVEHLLAQLSVEDKVGQMVQAEFGSATPDEVREYKLGSIIAGGDAAPGKNVRATAAEWLALTDEYARAAASASGSHVPIPLLFGIDAMHGHGHIPGATIFPHNIGLGAMHDPELLTRIGRVTAAEVASTGVDWTFAPTIAVVRDVRWGRSYESYSEDPALVAAYSAAMVSGLQGALGTPDFMAPGHTLATAKHFVGDGGTIRGRDQFDNRMPLPEFARVHGAGYPPAIDAGVLTVMASYNSWQGIKMHGNRALLTGVLKERLGFNGIVVGDWNAHEEVPGCTKFDCPAVIIAGLDIVMAPDGWKELYRNTLRHVRSGSIPASRIDDAVRRILRVKALAGLFERPLPSLRPEAGHFEQLGSAAHRAVAREAVRKSLVLLKNDGGLLPLSPHGRILVAGAGADNIGQQSGGWTIDWQGAHNTNAEFPGATSVYAAIKAAVTAAGGTASLSPDGQFTDHTVRGDRRFRRESVRRVPGRPRNARVLTRRQARPRADQAAAGPRRSGGRRIPVGPTVVGQPRTQCSDGVRRGVAAGQRRRRHRRRAAASARRARCLRFRGPAQFLLAPLGPAGDVRRRRPAAGCIVRARLRARLRAPGTRRARRGAPRSAARRAPERRAVRRWPHHGAVVDLRERPGRRRATDDAAPGERGGNRDGRAAAGVGPGGLVRRGSRPRADRRSRDRPARRRAAGEALQVRLRVTEPTSGPVRAGIRCGTPSGAQLPLAPNLAGITPKEWLHCKAPREPMFDVTHALAAATPGEATTLTIPLACFEKIGADLSAVDTPFVLSTAGRFAAELVDVRLARPAASQPCPAAD